MRHFLKITAIAGMSFCWTTVHSDDNKPTIYSLNSASQIISHRGGWSPGPDDVVIDLAGEWRLTAPLNDDWPESVTLPFAWDVWNGQVQIANDFLIPDSLAQLRWRLVVDGFAQRLTISLNNANLDARRGDNAALQLPLNGSHLHTGIHPNHLTITLDRHLDFHSTIPLRGGIYSACRYGGIFNAIYLVGSPPIRVADLTTNFILSTQGALIDASAQFRADVPPAGDCRVIFTLTSPDSQIIATTAPSSVMFSTDGNAKAQARFQINSPQFWQVGAGGGNYLVQVELVGPDFRHRLTASTIALTTALGSDGISLNGSQRQIHGVELYSADPMLGPLVDRAMVETDLRLMRNLGVDVVRFPQGFAPPIWLDACEKAGLMVLQGLPVFQAPDRILINDEFIRAAADQLSAAVNYYRRFGSIIGWGLGGDINPPNDINREYYRKLASVVRGLDPRPIFAALPLSESLTGGPLDFIIAEIHPWNNYSDLPLPTTIITDVPVILGGARRAVTPGLLGGWNMPFSESWQANGIVERLRQAERADWCSGVLVGDWRDWRGALPTLTGPFHGTQDIYTTGLVNQNGQTRLAFERLKAFWSDGTIEPLAPAEVNTSDGVLLFIVGFTLTAILVVSLRRNKINRLNLQRAFGSAHVFFQDIRDNRFFGAGQTILVGFLVTGGSALVAAAWLKAQSDNIALDWAAGHLINNGEAIQWLSSLVWLPHRALLFFWALAVLVLWLSAGLGTTAARWLRRKISLRQMFTFVVWAGAPGLALAPVGMIAPRLFFNGLGWIACILFAAAILWSLSRLIVYFGLITRCGAVISVFIWTIPPAILLALVWIILQETRNIGAYYSIFLNILN